MKITYNDMFDNISDVAFDVLEENHIFNDETDDMFSSDKTSKDVTDMILDQKNSLLSTSSTNNISFAPS